MSWFKTRQNGVGPLICAKKHLSTLLPRDWNKRVWSNIYEHKSGIACEYTLENVRTVEKLVQQYGSDTSVPCPRYEIMRTSSCEIDVQHNKIVEQSGHFFACRLGIDFEFMPSSVETSIATSNPDDLITRLCTELNTFLEKHTSSIEFYIMKCDHKKKISYHIVLHLYDDFDNEFFFKDAIDAGVVMKSFLKVTPFWLFAVDCSIYRSNSAFRLPYCSKPNGAPILPQRVLIVGEETLSKRLFTMQCFEDWLIQPTPSSSNNIMKINRRPSSTTTPTLHRSAGSPALMQDHPWFVEIIEAMQKIDARFNYSIAPLQYRFEINGTTCAYGKTHRSNHPWWVLDLWKQRVYYYCYDDECRAKYFDFDNNRVDKNKVRSQHITEIFETQLSEKMKELITARLTVDEILNKDSEIASAFRCFLSA